MGKQGRVGDRFRLRLKAERERRGWSQADVARALSSRKVPNTHATTIAKIEWGDRGVRVDELSALADLFGMSVDALIGHGSSGTDLVWAASKLTTNAQRMVAGMEDLRRRIADDLQDVQHYASFSGQSVPIRQLIAAADIALQIMADAKGALLMLAEEFPPG
jgi:transcriptional regulator with XRE-family HTH domain